MSTITISVNNKELQVRENDTVLDACLANGIDVPRLCDCPGLSNVGSCRMCVVEIEGERRPVPSCTYPVRNGLVVKTDTERLEKYRRQILELMFTERNHFCMYCEVSGDCELQKLAYRYQMDHVRYHYKYPELDVDTLSEFLVVDHNRCILCGRCVRACDEVAASRTVGFTRRGWETKVAADLQQSLGDSSCRLCGSCIQACPTGAIMNKLSYYRGTRDTCTEIQTACPGCSVGCELNVLVKDNIIRRIESPDLTGSITGSLCRIGRFELLETDSPRITAPMVRNVSGELTEADLEDAISAVADKLSEKKVEGIVSSKLPDETILAFQRFIKMTGEESSTDTTDGKMYRAIASGMKKINGLFDGESTLDSIAEADYILLAGADPQNTNPVISTIIRRTVNKTGAKLAILNEETDILPLWSYIWMNPRKHSEALVLEGISHIIVSNGWNRDGIDPALEKELKSVDLEKVEWKSRINMDCLHTVARDYSHARNPIIIYGESLFCSDGCALSAIATLAEITGNRNGILSLKPAANSRGAWEMGLAGGITEKPDAIFALIGDDTPDENLLEQLSGADYVVVQASYRSPATEIADVVLPSPIWAERSGSYTAIDGRSVKAPRVLKPVNGVRQDDEIMMMITEKLGLKIG